MSNQPMEQDGDLRHAPGNTLDVSAGKPQNLVGDTQAVNDEAMAAEMQVGQSGWFDDSDSDSDYEEQEDCQDIEVPGSPIPATSGDSAKISSADVPGSSYMKLKASNESSGRAMPESDSPDHNFDENTESESGPVQTPLDKSKFASYSACDYAKLLCPTEAATSGAEDSDIDQSLFQNFDQDNSEAITQHEVAVTTSEPPLADDFNGDYSDLILQYYSSSEAEAREKKDKNRSRKARMPKQTDQHKGPAAKTGDVQPAPAIRYNHRLLGPSPATKHGNLSMPRSPGFRRSRKMGQHISSLAPLPSPLSPNAHALPHPSFPLTDLDRDNRITSRTSEARLVSMSVVKQVKTPKPIFDFAKPRAAPLPARGTRHRRAGAICDTTALGASPLTPDEIARLTGISREHSRPVVEEYRAKMKAIDAEKSQTALNAQRTMLNLKLANSGMPVVAASRGDRAARIAETPEKGQKLTNAFLHEYHERYGELRLQYNVLVERLRTTEASRRVIEDRYAELQRDVLDVNEELNQYVAARSADKEAHRQERELLQEQNDRLKEETARLEKECQDATESLQSLQEDFHKQIALHEGNETQSLARKGQVAYDRQTRNASQIDAIREQLEATPSQPSSDVHQSAYSDEGQAQFHAYQLQILQLQQEVQKRQDKEARLTAIILQAKEATETLEADKVALTEANENLQDQLPPPSTVASTDTKEPASWAARRAAWRRTPEWKARYARHRQDQDTVTA